MKHNPKITIVLISMFILTQLIGLYVVNHYSPVRIVDGEKQNISAPDLPFGLKSPEIEKESDYRVFLYGIVFAFMIAILILFFLTKLNAEFILKLWFFVVVLVALGISINVLLNTFFPTFKYSILVLIAIALPLAFIKIYKKGFIVHNLTELFIYPGIAAVFVPILNVYTIIAFLILISIYDMWAVWRSGIMQKMAKYQIDKLNIFSGFFVPYLSRKAKMKIKTMKKTLSKQELKHKKIKVNVAILGGGDIIFPIIAAGVMLKTLGLVSALLVIAGATLGVSYLFFFSEKKKFYPAMPFITAGIFAGMILSYLIF
jgi:presenilin-like A22 family membrane protease